MNITESLHNLTAYIESEQFKGYDPYDTLNSWIPFHWFGRYVQALSIQFQKRNPINIRSVLGIRKDFNPKGMGLLLHAYTLLWQNDQSGEHRATMDFLFNWLHENYSKNYSGYCWGYNFTWANPDKVLKPFHPSVVVTSFVAKGIYAYYLATGKEKAKEVLKSCSEFILHDLPITETEDGICFSYTDVKKDCCYNASVLGAEILAKVYSITKEELLKEKTLKAVDFAIHHQHPDGHWKYSLDVDTGKERSQIDFHQGYIIQSLFEIKKDLSLNDERIENAIRKGLDFYFHEQFSKEGRSLWRLPKEYPVDIHNQSQGIITFALCKEYSEPYLKFAETIATYTIANMQHRSGYFYYRKFRTHTHKIPYMRWSQAWIMLALIMLKQE